MSKEDMIITFFVLKPSTSSKSCSQHSQNKLLNQWSYSLFSVMDSYFVRTKSLFNEWIFIYWSRALCTVQYYEWEIYLSWEWRTQELLYPRRISCQVTLEYVFISHVTLQILLGQRSRLYFWKLQKIIIPLH